MSENKRFLIKNGRYGAYFFDSIKNVVLDLYDIQNLLNENDLLSIINLQKIEIMDLKRKLDNIKNS